MVGISPSVYRYRPHTDKDILVIEAIQAVVSAYPAYGVRKVFKVLRRRGAIAGITNGSTACPACSRAIRVGGAKVEHSFGIIKRQFGFSTMRYRGLDKNAHRLFVVCALSNLVIARKALLKRSKQGLRARCA